MEKAPPQVGFGDDAREALGHADADARAAARIVDRIVLFFEQVEERAQGGQVSVAKVTALETHASTDFCMIAP